MSWVVSEACTLPFRHLLPARLWSWVGLTCLRQGPAWPAVHCRALLPAAQPAEAAQPVRISHGPRAGAIILSALVKLHASVVACVSSGAGA